MSEEINENDSTIHSGDITNECKHDVHSSSEQWPTPQGSSESALRSMDIELLMKHCTNELHKHQIGEASNDCYSLELFYRALMQRDALAWQAVQQCFNGLMYRWMWMHAQRELACRLDSEENYVAQGFARFWQTTVGNQNIAFKTLPAVLQYLHMSLNSTIIDTLRKYSRTQVMPLSELDEAREPLDDDQADSGELWEVIKSFLPDEREKRLAYLLFHCGLKPRQVVHFCAQEFSDVEEVYYLRRNIVGRLLRNKAALRWKLDG